SCDIDKFVAEDAKISVDYFRGEYLAADDKSANSMRKTTDNTSLSWFETYRRGLLLSLMADDGASERHLVDWIEPWLLCVSPRLSDHRQGGTANGQPVCHCGLGERCHCNACR